MPRQDNLEVVGRERNSKRERDRERQRETEREREVILNAEVQFPPKDCQHKQRGIERIWKM